MSEKSFDKEKLLSEVEFISIPEQAKFVKGIPRTAFKVNGSHYEFTQYNSLSHFINVIDEGYDKNGWTSSRNEENDKWTFGTHCPDLESTRKALILAQPPQIIFDKVQKLRDSLVNLESLELLMQKARSIKRKRVFSEDGDELCMNRILCGDPAHWSKMTKGKSNNVVKIAYKMNMAAGNSEENMYRLASFLCVVVDLLSVAGFAVQVDAYRASQNACSGTNGGFQGLTFPLKKAEDPLDIQKIACIGIPGLFRSYAFSDNKNQLSKEPSGGLGVTNPIPDHFRAVFDIDHLIDISWATSTEQCVSGLDKILRNVASEHMDFSVR